ncbi:carboxymuconolactone decarboxylase family protein [Sinorhizobium medicae]|uniref:carboxymuconolactone decarboxylase family protein n=1 Tax=Sinorhizobium medicae TaxID=110321 RepID=UPI000FD79238|nr:carboxymuconolactone decarboxylase family protein [Sinorhizobium medicae]RVH94098.1 carboxymuconolactone decarboxylase family protein [Sinorhizobium medicae]RVP66221.1 carboxymuconolactone decarboxylase family protein [Sinorhizobium medicae]
MSMIDWNSYHDQVLAGVGELASLKLAAAVSLRCDGCIVVHTEAALKAGATREEIAEALGTAIGFNAGAGLVYSTRVMDAVKSKS